MSNRIEPARLSLYPATDEQTFESRKRTFVQWNRGLDLDSYLGREKHFGQLPHAANGNLITWLVSFMIKVNN